MRPKRPNTEVKMTGKGFHEGPPARLSPIFGPVMWDATAWPQSIHAHGSELGGHEIAITVMIPTIRQPRKSTAGEGSRSCAR